MSESEREVLKGSLGLLKQVFGTWVQVERRQVAQFRNPKGQMLRFGRKGEADIGGWILQGHYIAKPLAIEIKRGDFRPTHVYGADKQRFASQCNYLREINHQGGVGFWISDSRMLYHILMPVLMRGARITLDVNNCVNVTSTSTVKVIDGSVHD